MATYRSGALLALGDPTRQQIFERLASGPRSVGELASALPVSRPAVSQHLRVLKDAGLVTDQAAGTRRFYRIDPAGIESIRAYLDRMWSGALAAFESAASAAAVTAGAGAAPAGESAPAATRGRRTAATPSRRTPATLSRPTVRNADD